MPLLIERLIETFYEELWNSWNDSAVDDTLGTTFEVRVPRVARATNYRPRRMALVSGLHPCRLGGLSQ